MAPSEAQRAWNKSGNARRGKAIAAPIFVRDGVPGKACVKCLEWKPLEKFARHESCAGGRRNTCTTCEGRRARSNNPAACLRSVKQYQATHPEAVRLHRQVGHRSRYGRVKRGPGVSVAAYRAILAAYGGCCAYCGEPATTMDHVTPLAQGGLHEPGNVVPACRPCNSRKQNRTPEQWRAAQARVSKWRS